MARLRTLKPTFFTHEQLCDLPPLHRILFAGLWCHADREGRLEDRPRFLKTVVLPYDNCDVDAMLSDLAARGFVIAYAVGGTRLLWIPKFSDHQQPHYREKPSTLPPFVEGCEITRGVPSPGPSTEKVVPSPSVFGLGDVGLGDVGSVAATIAAPPASDPLRAMGSTPLRIDPRPERRAVERRKSESRIAQLTDAMAERFEHVTGSKYGHRGAADANAVKRLMGFTPDDSEILRRWEAMLRAVGWAHASSIAQAPAKWNDHRPGAPTGPPQRALDLKRSPLPPSDHSKYDANDPTQNPF